MHIAGNLCFHIHLEVLFYLSVIRMQRYKLRNCDINTQNDYYGEAMSLLIFAQDSRSKNVLPYFLRLSK